MQGRLWRRLVAPTLVLALLAPAAWAVPARWAGPDLASWFVSAWSWVTRLWEKDGGIGSPALPSAGPTTGDHTDEGPGSDPWG